MNLRQNDAAIDSWCTTHTWPLTDPVQNIPKTAPSAAINVKLPNDQIMVHSHHGTVPIPDIPSSAQELKIFPDHNHGHKCPHPSFKCPEPNTGHIKNSTINDTRGGTEKEYKKK